MRRVPRKIIVPKNCSFCKAGKVPYFIDIETIRKFQTERGKIIGRARTGLCAKHQRDLSKAIKHARHLALLPFIGTQH